MKRLRRFKINGWVLTAMVVGCFCLLARADDSVKSDLNKTTHDLSQAIQRTYNQSRDALERGMRRVEVGARSAAEEIRIATHKSMSGIRRRVAAVVDRLDRKLHTKKESSLS